MKAIFGFCLKFAKSKSLVLSMTPGHCPFHSYLTIHAAGADMSMPHGGACNIIQNILCDKQVHKLNRDNFLRDDHQNPLTFSKAPILS